MKLDKEKISKKALWTQALAVVLGSPFFLFPSIKFVGVYIGIFILWVCRGIISRQFVQKSPLDWPLGILLFQVSISCLFVSDLNIGLPKILGILFGILTYYTILEILASEKLLLEGVLGLVFTGFIFSAVSILGIQWGSVLSENVFSKMINKIYDFLPKLSFGLPGAESGFNANAIGGTLILIIPISVYALIILSKKRIDHPYIRHRAAKLFFSFIITFVLMSVLFLTQSIGSWIALAMGAWILMFPAKWKKWSLAITLSIFVISVFINKNKENNLFQQIKHYELTDKIAVRKFQWGAGISAVNQSPLLGIGLNNLRLRLMGGYSSSHAHNHLLHTGAELGLPALVAYLAVLIVAGYMCYKVWLKAKSNWMKAAAQGLGCGQLAHFIFGLGDSIPLGAKVGIFFWISLAMITALYLHVQKRADEKI